MFRIPALWCAAAMLFLALMTLMFRNPVLTFVLQNKINHFNITHKAGLTIRKARIQGIYSVFLTGLALKPADGDTLLRIDTVLVSINLLKLLAGRLSVTETNIRNLYLTVRRKDSITNYQFLLQKRKTTQAADTSGPAAVNGGKTSSYAGTDYSETANRIFRLVFDKVPVRMEVANLNFRSITGAHTVSIHIDQMNLEDREFSTEIFIHEDSVNAVWNARGKLNNSRRYAELKLFSPDHNKISLPYIGFKWNAAFSFDSLSFSITAGRFSNDAFGIRGRIALSGLQIHHEKIAADTVCSQKLGIDYAVNFKPDAIELDSATQVSFNELDFHPYLKYRPGPSRQITLKINKPPFPAQDLFSSLPEGLFTNLKGIKTSGGLSYTWIFTWILICRIH
jgi:hypothetical protein